MARQVYFDPFGSYVGGYQRGVQQEQGMQQELRNARDSDYKFNVTNPLELNKLQREDELGATAQQYRLQMPKLGFQNAQAESFLTRLGAGRQAAQYGIYDPIAQSLASYNGNGTGYVSTGDGFQLTSPTGAPIGQALSGYGVLMGDPTNRAEQRTNQNQDFTQQVTATELNNSLLNSAYNRAYQEAQARAALTNSQYDQNGNPIGGTRQTGMPDWYSHMFGGFDFGGGDQAPAATAAPTAPTAPQVQQGQQPVTGIVPGLGPAAPQVQVPQAYAPSPRGPQPIPGSATYPQSAEEWLTWMRAANPNAPAMTLDEMRAMDPQQVQTYMRTYYPQLERTQ